jgi:hypothetical protein
VGSGSFDIIRVGRQGSNYLVGDKIGMRMPLDKINVCQGKGADRECEGEVSHWAACQTAEADSDSSWAASESRQLYGARNYLPVLVRT